MVGIPRNRIEPHLLQQLKETGGPVLLQHTHGGHVERALDNLVRRHGAVEGTGEVMRLEIVVVVGRILDERGGEDVSAVQHCRIEQRFERAAAGTGGRNHVHIGPSEPRRQTFGVAVVCNGLPRLDAQYEDSHIVYEVAVVLLEVRTGDGVDPVLQHRVYGADVSLVSPFCAQALKQMVGLVRHRKRLVRKGFVFCEFALDVVNYTIGHKLVQQ